MLCLVLGMALLAACQTEAPRPTTSPAQSAPVTTATDTAATATDTAAAATDTAAAATDTAAAATMTPAPEPSQAAAAGGEDAVAGETGTANADVEFVRATQQAGGAWRFDVTVRHPDSGWEDYADGWDVVMPDGRVLKAAQDDPFTRLLLHPHENEQPFTRSQSGVIVPDGVEVVIVRAHDLVDGFGGREIEVDLTVDSGPGFEVRRQ